MIRMMKSLKNATLVMTGFRMCGKEGDKYFQVILWMKLEAKINIRHIIHAMYET